MILEYCIGSHLDIISAQKVLNKSVFFKKKKFIYERDRERGRDTGRGRSRLPVGSLMWDSILGPRGHDLSGRQMLNC